MAKAATKEKESASKTATPERVGIHPEHREQAERLIARGKQQGYLTQEDIARGIPDAEAGEIEELLVTLDDNNVESLEADRGPSYHQVKEEEEETEELQREDSISVVLASDALEDASGMDNCKYGKYSERRFLLEQQVNPGTIPHSGASAVSRATELTPPHPICATELTHPRAMELTQPAPS